ncbi:zincin [Hymenopellis radicata]|nr:zincin [Hymenopellis radicata]
MLFTTTLALLSGATASIAFPSSLMTRDVSSATPSSRRCPSELSRERKEAAEKHFRNAKAQGTRREDLKTGPIPVYWNVIYENKTYEGGYLDEQQIKDQIDVINADYSTAGVSWTLANTTYVENADWFTYVTDKTPSQTEMKRALRQGGVDALNIYSVSFFNSSEGLLGYAEYPSDYESEPYNDGIVLQYATLPGGSSEAYGLGKTLTHEAGHWVGLYHTFEGGCEETNGGDQIADTPAQDSSTHGCPTTRDSCKGEPGLDPIHNYMDYSDDVCLTEFSAGQIERLQEQMRVYRGVDITI